MLVTLSGIVISIKLAQLQNALLPTLVTLLPSILPGISRILAEPLYLLISTVPSLSTVY